MKEDKNSDKCVNSLDYKIWSIAYDEDQIECIKHLIREEIKEAMYKTLEYADGVNHSDIENYLTSKGL